MTSRIGRREFLRLAGATASSILVVACMPAAAPSAPGAAPEAAEGETAGASADTERVELLYTTWGSYLWPEMVDSFNDSQDRIHATFEEIPWNSYREKMLTEIAAGQAPDVAEMEGYWMAEFVGRGVLVALDDYLSTDEELSLDKYIDGTFLDNLQVFEGTTYGLPSGDSPKVIWFNPEAFSEAGVMTPLEYEAEGQWDWPHFLEVVQALTSGEGAEKRYGYNTWMARADTDDIMRSFGGGWTDQEVTEVWCARPESVEGLQLILDVYLKHKAAPLAQEQQAMGGGQQMFLTGRLAMFHSGVWEIGTLGQDQTIVYDVAPLPQGPGGRFMFHKPNSLTIPSTTQNTDAAWELLRFMRGPEAEALWIQGNGMMPFLKDSIPLFLDKGKIPNAQLFIDALEKGWGHPLPVNENGARMDQAVADALGLALSEGRDAAWVVGDVEPKLAELVG